MLFLYSSQLISPFETSIVDFAKSFNFISGLNALGLELNASKYTFCNTYPAPILPAIYLNIGATSPLSIIGLNAFL